MTSSTPNQRSIVALSFFVSAALMVVLVGCGADARAVVKPTEGNTVNGVVAFTTVKDGVKINAKLAGLSTGAHGFHVHEIGDCSAPDGSSAGGHYGVAGTPHGSPTAAVGSRHIGDLGNVAAGTNGTANYEWVSDLVVLEGANSVLGKAVIVHAGEDDLTSQPSGAAGPRVACGIIE